MATGYTCRDPNCRRFDKYWAGTRSSTGGNNMPSIDLEPGNGTGGSTIAVLITVWIMVMMTAALIFHAYEHAASYEIPQFLIDMFVRICEVAVGGTALGAGIGLALHTTNLRIDTHKRECEHVQPQIEVVDQVNRVVLPKVDIVEK